MIKYPQIIDFIQQIVNKACVSGCSLIVSLLYIDRLKARLPENARGLPCSKYRIFLAAIIIATKFLNDRPPRNKSWAKFSGHAFSLSDINLMERQFLELLQYNLSFKLSEIVKYFFEISSPQSIFSRSNLNLNGCETSNVFKISVKSGFTQDGSKETMEVIELKSDPLNELLPVVACRIDQLFYHVSQG